MARINIQRSLRPRWTPILDKLGQIGIYDKTRGSRDEFLHVHQGMHGADVVRCQAHC
jgi:hypothetical protein